MWNRTIRRTLPALALHLCVGTAALAGNDLNDRLDDYERRIESVDLIIERFYRGESVTAAHERINSEVADFNKLVDRKNKELDEAKANLDADRAPILALSRRIDVLDQQLKVRPGITDVAGVRRYNSSLDMRNRLVEQHNAMNRRLKPKVATYNALVERINAQIAEARRRLKSRRTEFEAKSEAHDRLREEDDDVKFYTALNALYAVLHREARLVRNNPRLNAMIRSVRGFRRELGRWAKRKAESRENGLIIVEAEISSEPFFFILDTGAMQTTVSKEMVDVLGLSGKVGEQTTLVLAGGDKIKGRRFEFDRITVSRKTERDVSGVVVKASDVGIDGLLGQSFLKRFIYTVDESRKDKLILRPRIRREAY